MGMEISLILKVSTHKKRAKKISEETSLEKKRILPKRGVDFLSSCGLGFFSTAFQESVPVVVDLLLNYFDSRLKFWFEQVAESSLKFHVF